MKTTYSPQVLITPYTRLPEDETLMDDLTVVEYVKEIVEHRIALNNCSKISDEDHDHRLDRIAVATHILANFHNCNVHNTWDHRCSRGDFYLI